MRCRDLMKRRELAQALVSFTHPSRVWTVQVFCKALQDIAIARESNSCDMSLSNGHVS